MRKLKFSLMVAGFAALFLAVGAAKASAASYNLTSNHCSDPDPCGLPGTIFGTVTLVQNGTTVDITVDLFGPYVWAKTGSADFMLFKFNALDITTGDITFGAFGGETLAALNGVFNGDGTGYFAYGIRCTSCGNGISTSNNDLVFHIANAVIADITVLNAKDIMFVADLGNSLNGATGPIDSSEGCTGDLCPTITPHIPDAPEPTTLVLLGTGLLFAASGIRRRLTR